MSITYYVLCNTKAYKPLQVTKYVMREKMTTKTQVLDEPLILKQCVKPTLVILKTIAEHGGRARASDIVKKLHGWSLTSIYTNIRNAMLEGLVAKEEEYYILTEKGKEFLRNASKVMKQFIEAVENM